MISINEIILRLVVATILGGLIGLERESKNRPAGLRTHILVSLGSCLLMLVSMYGFENGDPARLAAQVVSGIGFLGAGTILRDGNDISGLTTAASIWVSGGIGLAIGNGYYMGGAITSVIVLFSLVSLGFFERQIFVSKYKILQLECIERIGLLGEIGTVIAKNNITIKDIKISRKDDYDESTLEMIVTLTLNIAKNFSGELLSDQLYRIQGVKKVVWNDNFNS
ncbi:MgtC/SapB family protein [Crassaminicella indica]|uniref:MgtC/SapB family protein n=1 Tax=Crassaminicella indica TaxID=2855394 RepID=A0ABX8RDC1_9CLOT|nr:MgtC/SapB family protein [Crassaminicella indica]QXM07062.1 MgtC/SapB family protein [Crassaminicella indica]